MACPREGTTGLESMRTPARAARANRQDTKAATITSVRKSARKRAALEEEELNAVRPGEDDNDCDVDFGAADGIVVDDDDDTKEALFFDAHSSAERAARPGQKALTSSEKLYAQFLPSTARGKAAMRGHVGAASTSTCAEEVVTAVEKDCKASRGPIDNKWYEIPKRELTPALRRELRLLKMRGVTDTKRFYKGNDTSKLPTRFQMGTVIEGAAEFYSSRLSRRERKATFVEEALADEQQQQQRKRRFAEIQEKRARLVKNKKRFQKKDKRR